MTQASLPVYGAVRRCVTGTWSGPGTRPPAVWKLTRGVVSDADGGCGSSDWQWRVREGCSSCWMQTCTEMWSSNLEKSSKPWSRSNKQLPLSYPANNVLMVTWRRHILGQTRRKFTVTYSASATDSWGADSRRPIRETKPSVPKASPPVPLSQGYFQR